MSPLWLLLTLLPVLGGAERFNCKTRILGGYYADAKSGCKAFHVCVRVAGGGIRDFRFYCPPGTLFHQEAQTCTDGGDDDPLACPADIYDGQFDLYRIGSGFDTKKLSSPGNQEDETEYGLQRAETGDRRLSQNNIVPNPPASDLRAAHSSDFFTGQRDRGRDEPVYSALQGPSVSQSSASFNPQTPSAPPRQSFRRPTTSRTITTQFTTPPPTSPHLSNPPQYQTSKRKLTRKRPVSAQTKIPLTTFAPYVPPQQTYPEKTQENFNRRVPSQGRQTTPNLPPQFKDYKDEYVEVSRVTPKTNRFYSNKPTSDPFAQPSATPRLKKEGLVELYNYEGLSTPGLNAQKDNRPFNVKNSFNVVDIPREPNFESSKNGNGYLNNRIITTTTDEYPTVRDSTTTPFYRKFNSVSYEQEKNSFIPYSKNNDFQNPITTTLTTTTTLRPEPPTNFNTVAYNTNIAFNVPSNNFAESGEDDGQYRPPQGEDDGQYRPELYEKELLTGAHSINIAASGNRFSENDKSYSKQQKSFKVATQTAAPFKPFNEVPTTILPAKITREPKTYTTTHVPKKINTKRTFDYYQTYTTTSRPNDFTERNIGNNVSVTSTTSVPKIPETRSTRIQSRPPTTGSATVPSQPTTRAPHFTKPLHKKEDASYDYAYYDSDSGFSEYDHNLEFGKTKTRT